MCNGRDAVVYFPAAPVNSFADHWSHTIAFSRSPSAVVMRSILLPFAAVIVVGAALAGGITLREQGNAPGPEIITVKQPKTDHNVAGRRPAFWLPDPEGKRHSSGL